MSATTLATRALIGLLTDITLTAANDPDDPTLNTVLLHGGHGTWAPDTRSDDDEDALLDAVPSDLLVATSTDRRAAAQAHAACTGRLHRPILVTVPDVKAIVALFKPLVTSLGRDTTHMARLTLEGETLTVAEDPLVVPDGRSVSMTVASFGPGSDYPTGVAKVLDPDPANLPRQYRDGPPIEATRGSGLSASGLAVVASVAKRRAMPAVIYRHHQDRPLVAEVGNSYRVVLQPYGVDDDQQEGPQIEVFDPLPAEGDGAEVESPLAVVVGAG